MPPRPRLPALGLAALSLALNTALLACAAHTLHVWHAQHHSNAYFLPVWPAHFDVRALGALSGSSAAVMLLNGVVIGALSVAAVRICTALCIETPDVGG